MAGSRVLNRLLFPLLDVKNSLSAEYITSVRDILGLTNTAPRSIPFNQRILVCFDLEKVHTQDLFTEAGICTLDLKDIDPDIVSEETSAFAEYLLSLTRTVYIRVNGLLARYTCPYTRGNPAGFDHGISIFVKKDQFVAAVNRELFPRNDVAYTLIYHDVTSEWNFLSNNDIDMGNVEQVIDTSQINHAAIGKREQGSMASVITRLKLTQYHQSKTSQCWKRCPYGNACPFDTGHSDRQRLARIPETIHENQSDCATVLGL